MNVGDEEPAFAAKTAIDSNYTASGESIYEIGNSRETFSDRLKILVFSDR